MILVQERRDSASPSAPVQSWFASGWLLFPILGVGLLARLLDIGRPFIGKHMWNEIFYVTTARDFEHFGPFLQFNFTPFCGAELSPYFGPSPLVPWMIYLSTRVFGEPEWAARLPMLVFGMFSLLSVYFIAKELYSREIALLAAFFGAVMPGAIFFSRQVALDSPMVAFGLAALLCLLLFERSHRVPWLVSSALFFALSVLAKYQGVLFAPGLLLIWVKTLHGGSGRDKRVDWTLAALYFVVSALPAVAWFAFGTQAASTYGTRSPTSGYLNRLDELSLGNFYWAAQVAWFRMTDQVGRALWYFLVTAMVIVGATKNVGAVIRRDLQVALLIIPWFVQFFYPLSWGVNDLYTYPALYGIAILLAVLARSATTRVLSMEEFTSTRTRAGVYSLIVLVLFSSLMDYKQVFRSSYHPDQYAIQQPVNAVTIEDPFFSARLVRDLNVRHEPVLADLPNTLYYAMDEYWRGRASWWWWGFPGGIDGQIAAIESREYVFVVFTLQPPVETVDALARSNYRRIAPAAWKRDDGS